MTKKHIIENLAAKSYFHKFNERGKPVFSSYPLRAFQYDTRQAAEMVVAVLASTLEQQTGENQFWNDGFLLTIVEVYV